VAAVALIFGPLIIDLGKLVVLSDLPVRVFSLGLSVVSRKPFLGVTGGGSGGWAA
jgi:hypothetical protein